MGHEVGGHRQASATGSHLAFLSLSLPLSRSLSFLFSSLLFSLFLLSFFLSLSTPLSRLFESLIVLTTLTCQIVHHEHVAADLAEDAARPSAWERVTQLAKRGSGSDDGGKHQHHRPTTRASITDEGHATWRETFVAGVKRSHVAAGTWAIDGKDLKAQELKAVWGAMFMKLRPEQRYFVIAYSARQVRGMVSGRGRSCNVLGPAHAHYTLYPRVYYKILHYV